MVNQITENIILGPNTGRQQEYHGPLYKHQIVKQGTQQEQYKPPQTQDYTILQGLFLPSTPIDPNTPHALLDCFEPMILLTFDNNAVIDIQGFNHLDEKLLVIIKYSAIQSRTYSNRSIKQQQESL